jgi:hypothetical protein
MMKPSILTFSFLILVACQGKAQGPTHTEGIWFGRLKLPQAEVRLAVTISLDDTGK